MKAVNLVTLLLVIIGAVNWGLVGAFDFNLVSALFGDGSAVARGVYVLVGLSGLWQLALFVRALQIDEPRAEAGGRLAR
ncbi:DUF378 domain-containing protein [Brevundimonas naejangsanensis]|uniref:DUF378 domain-containing protein n=1 Tax=Brevundimonas naejangsanensis TaxID=588932 RepID=A0A172Y466_9CAUL|nr:DUF378 domain-containing protein [Brevundimonas naejangsanensis]ANF54003.1 DUF378 domain-containing protein [Brevundimonas naejangsanensis]